MSQRKIAFGVVMRSVISLRATAPERMDITEHIAGAINPRILHAFSSGVGKGSVDGSGGWTSMQA